MYVLRSVLHLAQTGSGAAAQKDLLLGQLQETA